VLRTHVQWRLWQEPEPSASDNSYPQPSSVDALVQLPEGITELPALRFLKIHNSPHLESLPQRLGQLAYLEELHVEVGGLTSLPSSITQLQCLRLLDLSHCKQLTELAVRGWEALWALAAIWRSAVLEGMTSLPDSLGHLPNPPAAPRLVVPPSG